MKRNAKLFWDLFSVFFRIGLFTFGGGYAMISIVEDECVEKRGWISQEEMGNLVVLAESTPGPVAINCATFVGKRQGGFAGALWATFGMVLPSFLVILVLSRVLDRFLEIRLIANAFRGIQLAVGILILGAGWKLFRQTPKKPLPLLLLLGALVLSALSGLLSWGLSSIWMLVSAAVLSLLVYDLGRGKGGRP